MTGNRTRISLTALVLTLLLACLLTACGNAGQPAAQSDAATPAPAEETAASTSLGSLVITPETDTVDLEEAGATIEDLMRASDRLGGVKKIALGLTSASPEQLEAVCKAFPNAEVTWKTEVLGAAIESTAEELDLSGATDGDVAGLVKALAVLPEVKTLLLAPEGALTTLSSESLAALAAAAPEAELNCRFDLFGHTADWTTEELRYQNETIGDEGIEQFRAALPYLRALKLLRLENCGITDNDAMDALRSDFPDKGVVWSISIEGYTFMTDTTLINDGDTNLLYDGNVHLLTYMHDVLYLDIGHNHHLTNIEFARSFPKLQVVILTLTNISDLSPLENCPDLEFIECHSCQIDDLSPLADKVNLRYLNIANLPNLRDLSPLYGLKDLKLVRICGTTYTHISQADVDALKAELPDTFVSDYGGDPNSSGQWRYVTNGDKQNPTERYALLRQQMLYDLNWQERLSNSPSREEG